MKLGKIEKAQKYVGLYVIDFGDHSGVGFTAEEVAEIFESERYKDCKAYKIYNAYPDGRLELKGVRREIFELEMGMFFYSGSLDQSLSDYQKLINLAVRISPPCRAKVHLAKYDEGKYVTALIYPAEYNDQISSWLIKGQYKTNGAAEGGIEATSRYYLNAPEIIERHQLFGQSAHQSRTGEELLSNLKKAFVR